MRRQGSPPGPHQQCPQGHRECWQAARTRDLPRQSDHSVTIWRRYSRPQSRSTAGQCWSEVERSRRGTPARGLAAGKAPGRHQRSPAMIVPDTERPARSQCSGSETYAARRIRADAPAYISVQSRYCTTGSLYKAYRNQRATGIAALRLFSGDRSATPIKSPRFGRGAAAGQRTGLRPAEAGLSLHDRCKDNRCPAGMTQASATWRVPRTGQARRPGQAARARSARCRPARAGQSPPRPPHARARAGHRAGTGGPR